MRPGVYTIVCEKEGFRKTPLQTQVSAFDQANLGEQTMQPLAPGEMSEAQHARATELLEEFNIATESGDAEEKLAKLMELQEMMPDSAEVKFNIATTYEELGDKENAITYYNDAAAGSAEIAYDCHLAVADLHGKDREWGRGRGGDGKGPWTFVRRIRVAMFNYAVYAQNSGDAATAETAYAKTLEIDANRPMAHYQLGLIAVGKLENDAAIQHFEKFIELAPTHPQADEAQGVIDSLKSKGSEP